MRTTTLRTSKQYVARVLGWSRKTPPPLPVREAAANFVRDCAQKAGLKLVGVFRFEIDAHGDWVVACDIEDDEGCDS